MEELRELKSRMEQERPAQWEELPNLALYMDQIISYMSRQLIHFDQGEGLTSAMVNNYIKDGLVPWPCAAMPPSWPAPAFWTFSSPSSRSRATRAKNDRGLRPAAYGKECIHKCPKLMISPSSPTPLQTWGRTWCGRWIFRCCR